MKKMQFLIVALCMVLILGTLVSANSEGFLDIGNLVGSENVTEQTKLTFSDVAEDAPYAEQVNKLVEFGVLSGYEDGTFRPNGGVTRAEMCKMITLSFGLTDIEGAAGFPDITDNDWFKQYALAAQKAGIVDGFEDGTFRGKELITREQVCAIIVRVLKPFDLPVEVTIKDKVSEWAKPYVETILKNQLMHPDADGNFRATEVIKRHELATTLATFVNAPVEPVKAEVKFFVGGTQYGETQMVVCGEFPTVPENPTADEGMSFDGWQFVNVPGVVDVKSQRVYESMSFEAVFVKNVYTVKFFDGMTLESEIKVEHGTKITIPDKPVRDGFKFKGWALSENGKTVDLSTYKLTQDTSFYAVFETDNSEGGTGMSDTTEKVYYKVVFYAEDEVYNTQNRVLEGSYAKEPTTKPKKNGYKFEGWSTEQDGEVVKISKYKIQEDTEFYAVFVEVENPNSDELLGNLIKAKQQLSDIRMTDEKQKRVRALFVNCVASALQDGEDGELLTKKYIHSEYGEKIDEAKSIVLNEMTAREASAFYTLVTNNVDKVVMDFLSEYFDISASDYI